MRTSRETLISAVAVIVLVGAVALTWQIANVRAAQVTRSSPSDLVNTSGVPTHQTASAQSGTSGSSQTKDTDGDGIPDAQDRCPTRPETYNNFHDRDGCPDVVTRSNAS